MKKKRYKALMKDINAEIKYLKRCKAEIKEEYKAQKNGTRQLKRTV